jgi:hypothetical protein
VIPIPNELLEQVERGNVLLFIGERIVRDAAGRVHLDQLTAGLADRCGITDAEDLSFPEVAQVYEDEKGRQALIQFLIDRLEMLGDEPQPAHHLIVGLTGYCRVLITTNLNRLLERAFEDAGRPLDTIIGNVDVAFEDESRVKLYKLRGSLDRPESLILTEDDHEDFFRNRANLSIVLQGYLARKTILFLGYDLANPLFKRLYFEVTAPLDEYARHAYAFGETPSPRVTRWCERHGIDVVEADVTAFLEALTEQLADRARPVVAPPQLVERPVISLPERPYKLLDYYEAKDAAIFFGRGQETQTLSSMIHAHRLVLLYGASGTGKTSLLLAGVVPRLEGADPPYETLYVRALEDPALIIRRALKRRLPEADLPEDGPLLDFLGDATKILDRTLVIFLDQFEEFFIRLSLQVRTQFVAELGAVYDARDLPIKLVLGLREDWLGSVGEIESRIPEVFHTRIRLLPLTRDQARQAIIAPAERLGASYEPTLVDTLLADLADEGVMPPQLQLVCSTLYDRLSSDENQITLARYEELGAAAGILKEYLASELARLSGQERTLARGILKESIDSQGNKRVFTQDDLVSALGITSVQLRPVLEKLVRSHLVRPLDLEQRGETGYELAHEYLVDEIAGWFDPHESERKRVYELLRQDIERWRQFQTPIPGPTLDLIVPHGEDMLLQPEEWTLILRSAIQCGWDVEGWINRLGAQPTSAELLLELLRSPEEETRHNAARGWRYMPPSLVGDEAVAEVALDDPIPSIRTAAAISLAHRDPQRGAELILNRDGTSQTRRVEALAHIWDETAPLRQLPPGFRLPTLLTLARIRLKRSGRALLYHSIAGIIGGIITGLLFGLIASPLHWLVDRSMWETFGLSFQAVIAAWLIVGPWFTSILGVVMILTSTLTLALFKRPKRKWVLLSSALLAGIVMSVMLGTIYQGNLLRGHLWQACLNGFVIGSLLGGSVAVLFYHRQTSGKMPSPLIAILLGIGVGLVAGTITSFFPPRHDILINWLIGIAVGSTLIVGGIDLAIQNADRFIASLSAEETRGGWFK